MSRMPEVLREQAWHCGKLGSAFMDDLLTGLADAWPEGSALARRLEAWPDADIGPGGASLPLRLDVLVWGSTRLCARRCRG